MTTLGQGENSGSAYWKWPRLGPETAEQPRHRKGHPELLQPRAHDNRLDPAGYELGVAGQRCEPQAGLGQQRREAAQQVEDVGLVPGAVASEHVRVDDDERVAHRAACRYPATAASAVRSQV